MNILKLLVYLKFLLFATANITLLFTICYKTILFQMVMDGKGVLCINRSAYTHQTSSDFNMVALQDVIKVFFPAATLSECIEVFQNVLNVTVYKANWWEPKDVFSIYS